MAKNKIYLIEDEEVEIKIYSKGTLTLIIYVINFIVYLSTMFWGDFYYTMPIKVFVMYQLIAPILILFYYLRFGILCYITNKRVILKKTLFFEKITYVKHHTIKDFVYSSKYMQKLGDLFTFIFTSNSSTYKFYILNFDNNTVPLINKKLKVLCNNYNEGEDSSIKSFVSRGFINILILIKCLYDIFSYILHTNV